MKRVFSVVFMIAILATVAVVAAVDTMPNAEAKKGQGVPTSKFGLGTKGIVCGDQLCANVKHADSPMVSAATKSPSSMGTSSGGTVIDSITGATLKAIKIDKNASIAKITIDANDDGKIKFNIPPAIGDVSMVIVDGEQWDDVYIDGNQIKVYFFAGTEKIEIIGNVLG